MGAFLFCWLPFFLWQVSNHLSALKGFVPCKYIPRRTHLGRS
ncbi:unnamed protein product [Acanthoscelides obtectus]|uniref:Uncharacterized protein n=1 Tax=Acanthoscelides obtectus TaxID=200917 RepID=A0A9P0KIN6_ACAOB|nr:unnamed protein product [Acanthoscelides obtectus]CAK1644637.1 hypothetical protein AOBTE_LOCUS13905 [Acanthoscelides obtectus]